MKKDTLTICIGGSAGQGLVTVGQVLGKAAVRSGYYHLAFSIAGCKELKLAAENR